MSLLSWNNLDTGEYVMTKIVNYDFTIDSLISVEAPEGTDPETLVGQILIKIVQRVREKDLEIVFDTCFDKETGDYYEDWEVEANK
jgi:exoribonuclease II